MYCIFLVSYCTAVSTTVHKVLLAVHVQVWYYCKTILVIPPGGVGS